MVVVVALLAFSVVGVRAAAIGEAVAVAAAEVIIGGPVVAIGGLKVVVVAGTLGAIGGQVVVVLELPLLSYFFAVVVAVDVQVAT